MRAAYIGILTPGTTSRLRADCLRTLTSTWTWDWIDTNGPMQQSAHLWRSMAFRLKIGPVLERINALVSGQVRDENYDLVWVDKGVFLRLDTLRHVRKQATRLVHFTPDTAFHANKSRHHRATMGLYDLLVTTKSFEVESYRRYVDGDKILLTTQGYDSALHFPRVEDSQRRRETVFIGLAEPDREHCIAQLLQMEIPVRLAGYGWRRFLRRFERSPYLTFEGKTIHGEAYADLLSRAWVGLGLLSKRFPEQHTTRTFEIPACGAILASEQTRETARFFETTEALFFRDYVELACKVKDLFGTGGIESLATMAHAGRQRVLADGRDYNHILSAILSDTRLHL